MIQNGLRLEYTDRRDYDLLKSFGATAYDTNTLPKRYMADIGLTMPDQNADSFPMGCTGYAQADLCTNEDGVLYDAGELYLATTPFDRTQGRALRASMNVITTRGPKTPVGTLGPKRTAYYNVRAAGAIDWFDAIRIALWITQSEKRAVSVAIPWFAQFESIGRDGIIPDADFYEWSKASGHNAVIAGWTDVDTKGKKLRNGEMFLACKSWQGSRYGDHGWCYFPRSVINNILSMDYTEAMTVTKLTPASVQTVDLTVVERLISFIKNLWHFKI